MGCEAAFALFVGPSYPWFPHPQIQPTVDQRYLEIKIPESFKKPNLNVPCTATYSLSIYNYLYSIWASLVAQMVKNLPAILETQVRSLGQEDPLEKRMATHSSILAWEIP